MNSSAQTPGERWKVVNTHARGEVWVFRNDDSGPLVWGVKRGADEPLQLQTGTQVYGMPREVLAAFLDTVIKPAMEGGRWSLAAVYEILELYLERPDDLAPLLGLLSGRLHLASQIHELSERLSNLFIRYHCQITIRQETHERMALVGWCYQLANAFCVGAGGPNEAMSWVSQHAGAMKESFVEGIDLLRQAATVLLPAPQAARFASQLEFLLSAIELVTQVKK